jgi:hypothetical protein
MLPKVQARRPTRHAADGLNLAVFKCPATSRPPLMAGPLGGAYCIALLRVIAVGNDEALLLHVITTRTTLFTKLDWDRRYWMVF